MDLTECFKLLLEVYGEDVMSRTQIFEWHTRFVKGREEMEDDPKTGRPSTTRTDENITRVNQLVQNERRLTNQCERFCWMIWECEMCVPNGAQDLVERPEAESSQIL